MIEEPPPLTVSKTLRRPSEAQIAAFRDVPAGFVADALGGGGALAAGIQALGGGRDLDCRAAGPALTADCGPADILATLATLHYLRPGDVVVAAFGGHRGCAAIGDRVACMMKNGGAAAFVTDGPARDYAGLVAAGLPLWCNGLTPASPHASGPGTVGFAISIGGVEVETGDMVIADRDGVVVVPFERIDAVIERLVRIRALESELDARVAGGLKVHDRVVELLAAGKVRFSD